MPSPVDNATAIARLSTTIALSLKYSTSTMACTTSKVQERDNSGHLVNCEWSALEAQSHIPWPWLVLVTFMHINEQSVKVTI